jgi:hypothetical protein
MKNPKNSPPDTHDNPLELNPEVDDTSVLICQLVDKMASCHHTAIASLAVALGRMCHIYNIKSEDAYEVVIQAEIAQSDLENEQEVEAIEEASKKDEPKN